ncbi:MAG: hypothetical protein ACK4UJ_06380 [Leptonema sp. (in: bacteria)]
MERKIPPIKNLYAKIDSLLEKLPPNIKKGVVLFAISIWFVSAIFVVLYTYQKGKEKAPYLGEDYFLEEVKEKIQKNQNLKKKSAIILPDLNDLIKQEIPLKMETIQDIPKKEDLDLDTKKKLEILTEKDEIKFYKDSEKKHTLFEESPKEKRLEENKENKINKKNKLEPLNIEN